MKLLSRWLAGLVSVATVCAIGFCYEGGTADAADAVAGTGTARDTDVDYSTWAVDPTAPGPDVPPVGRSLFDHLVTERAGSENTYRVPYPISALIDRIQARLAQQEFLGGTRVAMIPMGRSLQRSAAAPDFFKFPRIVFAVTGEPAANEHDAGTLLKDRLYLGYVEKTGMLEVISYNEAAGRFDERGSGRIAWLNFGPAGQARDLLFQGQPAQRAGSGYTVRAVPKKNGLAARLPDGRALAGIEIRWPVAAAQANPSKPVAARFEVVLLDDFALVRQAIDRLLADQASLFDDGPLVRANGTALCVTSPASNSRRTSSRAMRNKSRKTCVNARHACWSGFRRGAPRPSSASNPPCRRQRRCRGWARRRTAEQAAGNSNCCGPTLKNFPGETASRRPSPN